MEKDTLLSTKKKDPKQQEIFDIAVSNAVSIIHNEKTTEAMLRQITSGADIIDEIAKVALGVITRIEQSASDNGVQIDESMKTDAANIIVGEIIGVVEAAGIEKLNDDQRYQAFAMTVSSYIDNAVNTGKLSKEQLIAMGEQASRSEHGQKVASGMRGGVPDVR